MLRAMKRGGHVVLAWLVGLCGGVARAQAPLASPETGADVAAHRGTPEAEALPLAYDEALALLDHAPALRARIAATQQLRAAKQDVSSLQNDMQVSFEAGPRITSPVQGQGRVAVSQWLSLSGLGSARKDVLDAQADAVESERVELRVLRRLRVGQAWLRVHAAHASVAIAQAEYGLAQALAEVTQHAARLSELTRADAADAGAYAAEARLAVLSAEGELTDARLDLTHALAVSERVIDVRGDPPDIAPPTPNQEKLLHERIEQQPALLSLVRRAQALEARERAVRAMYRSQLYLGAALDRSDPSAWAVLGTVGFTLPWFDRGAHDRAELSAERTTLRGEADEQRAILHVEIERLLHEIEHAQATLNHADTELLPAVERGLAAREALFRAGEGTVIESIVARRNALALRMRRVQLHTGWLSALLRFRELAMAVGALDGAERLP